MTRKVVIKDAETGETLRETYATAQPLLLGMFSPSDVLKIASASVMIIVFFVNGQNDKKLMQENLAELRITTSRLTDFKENSDSWNGQVFGTRFKDGQPIDNNFKVINKGNINR